jgi:hypothetical protein
MDAYLSQVSIDQLALQAGPRKTVRSQGRRARSSRGILALSKSGIPIKQMVRQTGRSRKLVRQAIRGERTDVFRTWQSSLDLHLPWLDDQWASGCRNMSPMPIADVDEEKFDRLFAINVRGVLNGCKLAAKRLRD